MSEEQFEQKGNAYKPKRKKAFARPKLDKADLPPNISEVKFERPVISLVCHDTTIPHSEDKKYFMPISGWNDEYGNIRCSWSQKTTRPELKAFLETRKKNKNFVQYIKLKNAYEDEMERLKESRVSITAIMRGEGLSDKERYKTLWSGVLDPRTGTITGDFIGSDVEILNIFRNCTVKEEGEPYVAMSLKIYRPKDSYFKQLITADPAKYVPKYEERKAKRAAREAAQETVEIQEKTDEEIF